MSLIFPIFDIVTTSTTKLTLPINHPFWEIHKPGDRWNCKCSLKQTDEPVNASGLVGWTPAPPQPGQDNNPAKDGQIFSDTHPYYTEAYPGAEQAVNNLLRKRSPSSLRRTEEEKARILRDWNARKQSRDNEARIAEILQVPMPRRSMTFEEANALRSNPNYQENVWNMYSVNCQSCVVSHELRMRGWDVEAIGNNKRRDSLARRLSRMVNHAWIDPTTNSAPLRIEINGFDDLVQRVTTIGRYHVRWGWNGSLSGHIITFERTKNEAFFYDPQDGTRYSLEEINRQWGGKTRGMQYYRVDNLNVNPDFVRVVKPKKKRRNAK